MEGTVESGNGLSQGLNASMDICKHEIDEKALPEWKPSLGKVWTCIKCGAKVHKEKPYYAVPGKRVHMSKKQRRRERRSDK